MFLKRHSILVAKVDEGFTIIDGHVRVEAAKIAGLEFVWAYVAECDEEEALMLLVTENIQTELSPIEIGLHCLATCEPSGGGRGVKGGISAYAQRVGYSRNRLVVLRRAASVAESCRNVVGSLSCFADKVDHLSEIGKIVNPKRWADVTRSFLELDNVTGESWNVSVTRDRSKAVESAASSIPEDMIAFSPQDKMVRAIVVGGMDPQRFKDIVACWGNVRSASASSGSLQPLLEFEEWMASNAGDGSFDVGKVVHRASKAIDACKGVKQPSHEVVVMANGPEEWEALESEFEKGVVACWFNGGDVGKVFSRASSLGLHAVDVSSCLVKGKIYSPAFVSRRVYFAIFAKEWPNPDQTLSIEEDLEVEDVEGHLVSLVGNLWLGCAVSRVSSGNLVSELVG